MYWTRAGVLAIRRGWVTARADDTLFRAMASSLTAEERLGISANWP